MVVVDPVEKFLQVNVHDVVIPLLNVSLCPPDGHVRTPAGAESETAVGERSIPARLQDLQDRLLNETVLHGRYPQEAHTAAQFGNLNPPDRFRLVRSLKERPPDSSPVAAQMIRQLFDGHPVDSGLAPILNHSSQCALQILR